MSHFESWPGLVAEATPFTQMFKPEQMIYLTAESENTLHELDEATVYVIGAVVDRNRHKGMCEKLATEAGIRTARLPIQEHMDMESRVVITIDQVFLILAKLYNGSDMKEALTAAMPPRKEWKLKDENDNEAPAEAEDAANVEEVEEELQTDPTNTE
eukprot:TRINITY_DN7172_c0_g1_i1.p1 TRINITY_DN7172_c0_g1~~TRINITY_DN7172_c0_g1_i1.p1  ORF type:complete len:157 (-),score=56.19 TRINITY_DN7172_c0_g1_i1:208-678(-)